MRPSLFALRRPPFPSNFHIMFHKIQITDIIKRLTRLIHEKADHFLTVLQTQLRLDP